MPLNINSGTVTPQQALKSMGDADSLADKLNKNKIGDNQILYASSKGGDIKGNRFHKKFTSKSDWKDHKENAKNEVVKWIKDFKLSDKQTDELVSHIETKFEQTGELRGRDLKEIAKMAQRKLKPFADKPFVCPQKADANDLQRANVWMKLNKDQVVAARKDDQGKWTLVKDPKATIKERMNVAHALFSMTPMGQKIASKSTSQQTMRALRELPPVPTHDVNPKPPGPNGGARVNFKFDPIENDELLEIVKEEAEDDDLAEYLDDLRDMFNEDSVELDVDYGDHLFDNNDYFQWSKAPDILDGDEDDWLNN